MKKNCFVICPIGEEGSEERKHANEVRDKIVKPIVESEFGYNVVRADEFQVVGQITPQIVNLLVESDLVIADLSFHNPNVFYELALRHITRKPFIHLIREEDKIPFDIKDIRVIKFNLKNEERIEGAKSELREQIKSIEKGEFGAIQYISTLLGRFEIIFPALKYFAREGMSEDNSKKKFGRKAYKDRMITNLDYSDSMGDELELENVYASRIDASDAKLGVFHIKGSIINLLDISGCQIKRLVMEGTKINIMDASESSITVFIRRGAEFANPPDFSGAKILEEVEE